MALQGGRSRQERRKEFAGQRFARSPHLRLVQQAVHGAHCERDAGGDGVGARNLLMDLLAADLRCLDAHAHLGNFAFDHGGDEAHRHYDVGIRIGELSLGEGFNDVSPLRRIGDRPFLQCLRGYGLTLWRAGRADEARMLWLNPMDNQGVRFVLHQLRAGEPWRDEG